MLAVVDAATESTETPRQWLSKDVTLHFNECAYMYPLAELVCILYALSTCLGYIHMRALSALSTCLGYIHLRALSALSTCLGYIHTFACTLRSVYLPGLHTFACTLHSVYLPGLHIRVCVHQGVNLRSPWNPHCPDSKMNSHTPGSVGGVK